MADDGRSTVCIAWGCTKTSGSRPHREAGNADQEVEGSKVHLPNSERFRESVRAHAHPRHPRLGQLGEAEVVEEIQGCLMMEFMGYPRKLWEPAFKHLANDQLEDG